MPVNLNQYHGTVGVFNNCNLPTRKSYDVFSSRLLQQQLSKIYSTKILVFLITIANRFVTYIITAQNVWLVHQSLFKSLYFITIALYIHHVWVYFVTIKLSGNIEENLGPQSKSCNSLSICHWNLNSIPANNFIKLPLLHAYISINKFGIICLSETYLDPIISSNDGNLEVPRYNLVCADNPNNTKRGGACIYYLNSLPFKVLDIKFLNECINSEINIGGIMHNFIYLYRSPSQTWDTFETFADNLELTLDALTHSNPFLIVAIGNFNAKTTNWYKNDTTSYKGLKNDAITFQFGLQQLINESTRLKGNSSSCIDLIFTSQPNLVMELGVRSSLHPNCHHQIVFAKF